MAVEANGIRFLRERDWIMDEVVKVVKVEEDDLEMPEKALEAWMVIERIKTALDEIFI